MRKRMKRWMQVLLACVLALVCTVTLPAQAQAATKYVETSEKTYTYDSSAKKYTLDSTVTFKYNKKGLMTQTKYVSKSSGYSNTYKYTYDSSGNIKTEKLYENGTLSFLTKYTYDKKGRTKTETQTSYYNGTKETTKYTYTYSSNGKSATKSDNSGNTTKYTYYSNGNIKTLKNYYNGVQEDARSYDKYGNTTKYTYYNNWGNCSDYVENYYGTVSTSKLKKNKVASDVTTTVYTYCDAKNGKLKKTTETCTFYNESGKKVSSLSYKGKVMTKYYTSGYRKGWIKDSAYKYTADKTKKNVGVQKIYSDGVLQYKTVYTWKKISY